LALSVKICKGDQFPRPNNHQKNHQPRNRHFLKTYYNQRYHHLLFHPATRT